MTEEALKIEEMSVQQKMNTFAEWQK